MIMSLWYFLIFFVLVATRRATPYETSTRIVSFNSGLTPKVANYDDRRLEIAPALVELNADIVCLQEVWSSRDVSRIVEELRTTYPYTYSDLHDDVGNVPEVSSTEAPCLTTKFVLHFLPCLAIYCSSSAAEENFLSCAERCELLDLEQHCISCLIMAVGASPVQRCLRDTGHRFNIPGLLVLSNRPLEQPTVTRFEPNSSLILPRGYISAKVSGVGKIVCTHMTANLGQHYFENLDFHTWQDQNNAEARALVEVVQGDNQAIVMGDINSSPDLPASDVQHSMEGAFNIFSEAGFATPYTDSVGICTWCRYNPLAHARDNLILDHIFTKHLTVETSQRVLDDVRVRGKYPLSDHYGIEVTVTANITQP